MPRLNEGLIPSEAASEKGPISSVGLHPPDPLEQPGLIPSGQFMFPDPQHAPTVAPQRARNETVTGLVCRKLGLPEIGIVAWLRRVLRTAVPEATVHKHREPEPAEDKVRSTENLLISTPSGDAVSPHQIRECEFSRLVSPASDPRHHLRALGGGEYVSHEDGSQVRSG